jgi:hypothetical protein
MPRTPVWIEPARAELIAAQAPLTPSEIYERIQGRGRVSEGAGGKDPATSLRSSLWANDEFVMVSTTQGSRVSLIEWFDEPAWTRILDGLQKTPPRFDDRVGRPQPRQIDLALSGLNPRQLREIAARVDLIAKTRPTEQLPADWGKWLAALQDAITLSLESGPADNLPPAEGYVQPEAQVLRERDKEIAQRNEIRDLRSELVHLADLLGFAVDEETGSIDLYEGVQAPKTLTDEVDKMRTEILEMRKENRQENEAARAEYKSAADTAKAAVEGEINQIWMSKLQDFISSAETAKSQAATALEKAEKAEKKVDEKNQHLTTMVVVAVSVLAFLLSVVLGFYAVFNA